MHSNIIAKILSLLEVILRCNSVYTIQGYFSGLENRNINITTKLSNIIKTFEDFKLVAQIREEIERVSLV